MLVWCLVKTMTTGDVVGYLDSDYAWGLDKRLLTFLCLHRGAGNWRPTVQTPVALSMTEVEYIARTMVVKEGIWFEGLIGDFGMKQDTPVVHCHS